MRFDNRLELTALAFAERVEENEVQLEFIKLGNPIQNGFIERSNRNYREAVLNMFILRLKKMSKIKRKLAWDFQPATSARVVKELVADRIFTEIQTGNFDLI